MRACCQRAVERSGPAHSSGRNACHRRDANFSGDREGVVQGKSEAGELQRPLAEPRALHCRDAPQAIFPDVVQKRSARRGIQRPARSAQAGRHEARLASARGRGARRMGRHGRAGQLGVPRSSGFRRRGVVHSNPRMAARQQPIGPHDWARQQHVGSLGQRSIAHPAASGRTRRCTGGKRARLRSAHLRRPGRHAAQRTEHHHRPHPEQPQ